MALRVAQSNAPEIGRSRGASPDRLSVWGIASIVAVIAAVALVGPLGDPLGSGSTGVLCLTLLIFGLPHGSLDIALIRHSAKLGRRQIAATVALYLGLAAVTYAVWHFAPLLALAGFLVVSSVHFAEDWSDALPPFFAIGSATALLTAPTLFHHSTIADIFVVLTAHQNAALLADLALLMAPVALIAIAIGIGLLIHNGRSAKALETTAVVAAMIVLPPILGFAIFFCLSHSPRHFAAARAEVRGRDTEAVLLTGAAIGVAALFYSTRGAVEFGDKAIFASFVTLSVLTVPHMIVPRVMNRQQTGPRC